MSPKDRYEAARRRASEAFSAWVAAMGEESEAFEALLLFESGRASERVAAIKDLG